MTTSGDAALDELLESLPETVVNAAEILSVPHWTEDSGASELVREFGTANGTTLSALAEVKSLPFVAPHRSGWRIASPVRDLLVRRVDAKRDLSVAINAWLADRLRRHNASLTTGTRSAREAEWRTIYHEIPVAPRDAFRELDAFVERASVRGQRSDLDAAVGLTLARRTWLADYQAEVAFVVAQRAYAIGDLTTAEENFEVVWGADTDGHRRVVAGHLLGVIWSRRNKEPWWSKAEALLTDAASVARASGDRYGEAVILTTLGTLQGRLGGEQRLRAAESALRRSVEVGGPAMEAMALSSLGAILASRGGRERLLEAEQLLRRSLDLTPDDAKGSVRDRLARVLGQLGGSERLAEAERLSIEAGEGASGDRLGTASRLNTLAATLLKRGDRESLEQAEDAAQRSIELGREIGNRRHTAMALLTGSLTAERRGALRLAIERMQEVIEINEALGFDEQVRRSQARLARLRAKRPADGESRK